MEDNRIIVVYGDQAKEMTLSLLAAAQIEKDIPLNARIGIKPNLVTLKPQFLRNRLTPRASSSTCVFF